MEIKKFIGIYDEALPLNVLGNLLRYANICKFEKAGIISEKKEGDVDFDVRRTYIHSLSNLDNKLSNVHWYCFLYTYFNNGLKKYAMDNKILDIRWKGLSQLAILKYENTGFYTWHTDHAMEAPRTMSCILLLNNDYEGGNLCFRNPDGSGEWEVDVKPNRLIVWPSNFLYPHTVKPVTKGTRYSVVAWAL
jgi:hypothetical protein